MGKEDRSGQQQNSLKSGKTVLILHGESVEVGEGHNKVLKYGDTLRQMLEFDGGRGPAHAC